MPYIDKERRTDIVVGDRPDTKGELTFSICAAIDVWLGEQGITYDSISDVIGVLECAKLEAYRRIAAPYEDRKLLENGEVFFSL